jgi:hypothetical protein
MIAVVGSAATVLVLAVRRGGPERRRALALGCFLVGALLVILAVGYGRAALVPTEGLPDRYVLLAVPVLLSAWFAWELFGPARWRRGAQLGLLVAVVALVPLNTRWGYEWRDWYSAEMNAVECDIAAGRSRDELVERHGDFLMHWSPEHLSWSIDLLREERIGPFAEVQSDSGTGAADPAACAILDTPSG